MRDKMKSQEYFNQYIAEDTIRINKFINKLVQNEVREDRILSVKIKIHDLKLGILIAKYSRGDCLTEIKRDFINIVDEWQEVWQPEFYIKNLWMISLNILLGGTSDYLNRIRQMLFKYNINDWLYNFLLNYQKERMNGIQGTLLFPEIYNELKDVILNEIDRSERLQQYTENSWYKKHSGCGWYDSHKSKENLYYGYWSFEVGAVAKILNISDDKLRGNQYYPYDLVHFME